MEKKATKLEEGSEFCNIILDLEIYEILYCVTRWKTKFNTLIKSGGGNRPYDAQQPTSFYNLERC